MKKLYITIAVAFFCVEAAIGQSTADTSSIKMEMEKLSFIVGEWEGAGLIMGRDGASHEFTQTETVEYKLDGTAILIEGIGKSGGEIIHNAMAVLKFDQENGGYSFDSYLSKGLSGSFKGELIGDTFYWYPNENMRYIIKLNEQGQWFETGEINQNGTWVQIFEMTLNKV